jgi:hypothetical protein
VNLNALLDPLAVALLVVTAVLYPWSGVWEYHRLVRWNASELPDARVRHYNWIAAWEWVSVAVFLSWWFWTGRQAATLGLVPDPSGWQWLAITVGLLTVFSGSLFTAIVVHVVMDVTSGRIMGTAIRLPADSASAEVGREK